PQEVAVIRDAMSANKKELNDKLWRVVERPKRGEEDQRLRAACALATYDPNNPRWAKDSGPVANQLVAVSSVFLVSWMEALRPIRTQLLDPLSEVFRDRTTERAAERSLATE